MSPAPSQILLLCQCSKYHRWSYIETPPTFEATCLVSNAPKEGGYHSGRMLRQGTSSSATNGKNLRARRDRRTPRQKTMGEVLLDTLSEGRYSSMGSVQGKTRTRAISWSPATTWPPIPIMARVLPHSLRPTPFLAVTSNFNHGCEPQTIRGARRRPLLIERYHLSVESRKRSL